MNAYAVLVGIAVILLVIGAGALTRWATGRRHGRLLSVDSGTREEGVRLVSSRYRLVGRPDEVRERTDGMLVPVEWKHRSAPAGGPPRSHVVQVWAYALLLEETRGRRVPFGILRYGDGVEFRLPWTPREREELLALRERMERPYAGEATPSIGRCRACRWRLGCDARAA